MNRHSHFPIFLGEGAAQSFQTRITLVWGRHGEQRLSSSRSWWGMEQWRKTSLHLPQDQGPFFYRSRVEEAVEQSLHLFPRPSSPQSEEQAESIVCCSMSLLDQTGKAVEQCTGVHFWEGNSHRRDFARVNLEILSPKGAMFPLGEIESVHVHS